MIDVLKRIDDLRKERGWSVYKLAYEAEITQSTLANMFARKSLPSLATLSQICDAFGIEMSDFFKEDTETDFNATLISDFNSLNRRDKKIILDLMKVMINNNKDK